MTRQTGLVAPCYPIYIVPKDTAPTADTSNKTLMKELETPTAKPHPDKRDLVLLQILVQTKPNQKSNMKEHKQLNPKEHIQALQTGKF